MSDVLRALNDIEQAFDATGNNRCLALVSIIRAALAPVTDEEVRAIRERHEELERLGELAHHDWASEAHTDRATLLQALTEAQERAETQAAQDVLAERERQKSVEGWSASHDDEYDEGQLPRAAAAYAISAATPGGVPALSASMFGCQIFPTLNNRNFLWPWEMRFWKPKDPRRDLVRAGALILAEIERLDRAAQTLKERKDG